MREALNKTEICYFYKDDALGDRNLVPRVYLKRRGNILMRHFRNDSYMEIY